MYQVTINYTTKAGLSHCYNKSFSDLEALSDWVRNYIYGSFAPEPILNSLNISILGKAETK